METETEAEKQREKEKRQVGRKGGEQSETGADRHIQKETDTPSGAHREGADMERGVHRGGKGNLQMQEKIAT